MIGIGLDPGLTWLLFSLDDFICCCWCFLAFVYGCFLGGGSRRRLQIGAAGWPPRFRLVAAAGGLRGFTEVGLGFWAEEGFLDGLGSVDQVFY